MKKKFLMMLAIIFIIPFAFLLGACDGGDPPDNPPPEKAVEYITVEPDINDMTLTEHWNADTKTFTFNYGEYYSFSYYSFRVTAHYDDDTQSEIYEYTMNIPEELQNGNAPVSETPYEIAFEYETKTTTVHVKIQNLTISAPTNTTDFSMRTDEYTFDSNPKTLNLQGYDPSIMELAEDSDPLEQTNAGNYVAKIKPMQGYVWEDGTTDTLTFNWKIWKKEVEKPQILTDHIYRYNGQWGQGAAFDYENGHGIDYSLCSVDGNDYIEIGEHTTTVSLDEPTNYCWEGEGEDSTPLEFVWTMQKGIVEVPIPTWGGETLEIEYNGQKHTFKDNLNWFDYFDEMITLTGDIEVTEVALTSDKKYVVTAEILDPAHWEWEEDAPVWEWKITPKCITAPGFSEPIHLYYSGPNDVKESGFELEDWIKSYVEFTDDSVLQATEAGTYSFTIRLKDTRNYCWYEYPTEDPITYNWTINPLKIYKPTSSTINSSRRTFNTQTYYITNNYFSNSSYLTISGDTEATHVGTYTVKINIDTETHGDNVIWAEDETQEEVSLDWTIEKFGILPLTVDNSKQYTFNGTLQTFEFTSGYNLAYVGVYYSITGNKQTDAVENKKVTATLLFPDDTYWLYDDGDTLTFNWTIKPQEVLLPYVVADVIYVYNTESQTVSLMNADADYIEVTDNTFTDAGDYVAKVTLTSENYKWKGKNKTVRTISLDWRIDKCQLVKPTPASTNFVFESIYSTHEYIPNGFDDNLMNISGNVEALSGVYTAVITIKDTVNYMWGDTTQDAHEITWSVSSKPIQIPALVQIGWVYDGTPKTPKLDYVLPNLMVITGDTTKTDAGSYRITVSLNDDNYMWSDQTHEPKVLGWGIAQLTICTEDYDFEPNFTRDKSYFYFDGQPKQLSLDLSSFEYSFALEAVFEYFTHIHGTVIDPPSEIGHYYAEVEIKLKAEYSTNYRIYNPSTSFPVTYGVYWGIVSPTIDVASLYWDADAMVEGETNSYYIPTNGDDFSLENSYLYKGINLRLNLLPGIIATYTYEKYNETTKQYEMQYYKEGALMDMFNETGKFRVTATVKVADAYKDIVTFKDGVTTNIVYATVIEATA